jgi:probable rRNA maturation factor
VTSSIFISNQQKLLRVPRRRIEQAVTAALKLGRSQHSPVSIVLVNDRQIRRLHREYLGLDSATDVLSFACEDPPAVPRPMLGEVVVSVQTARREAQRHGHPVTFEVTLYAAHGVLHLLGYDDHATADRRAMRQAERRCLRAAGIARDLFPSEP